MPKPLKRSPIILIPGLGGSQLWAKLGKTSELEETPHLLKKESTIIFVAVDEVVHPAHMSKNLELEVLSKDEENPIFGNFNKTIIETPNFGKVNSISHLTSDANLVVYMEKLIRYLEHNGGYQRNKTILGAPYDFRQISVRSQAEDYFKRLKKLIEYTFSQNSRKVTLVSHSLGCIMISWFLTNQRKSWKKKYIHHWVSIAGPFRGSVKMLKSLLYGDSLGIPGIFHPSKHMQKLFVTCPVSYFMLPQTLCEDKRDVISVEDQVFTTEDYEDLFQKFEIPNASFMLKIAQKPYAFTNIGIPITGVLGFGVKTVDHILTKEYKINASHKDRYDDGDGTVPSWSLEGINLMKKDPATTLTVLRIKEADHHHVLYHHQTANKILDVTLI